MKYLSIIMLSFCCSLIASAKDYFVATDGNDSNDGSIEKPFATLKKAYETVGLDGDAIYLRGGTYVINPEDLMQTSDKLWARAFVLDKKPASQSKEILISGYGNERPVIDMSRVKPTDRRVQAFYIIGRFHHIQNLDVVGVQVTILDHTQSECFRIEGGNYNTIENVRMHDGMGIGVYISKGLNNLVLNCDAYNIDDPVSEGGKNENTDGFGGHPSTVTSKGNVFRGCRAWNCGDDGFDLISANAAVTIDNCWAFLNGYRSDGSNSGGNGNGIKAGGYGMSENPKAPDPIPQHVVTNCISYGNKAHGFYANHHLGGIVFMNNSAYQNMSGNYNMLNRKSATEVADVPGYGHVIWNNISLESKRNGDIRNVDEAKCYIGNNSFLPDMKVTKDDFESVDVKQLMASRKADGSLPDITFMKPKSGSTPDRFKMGYTFPANINADNLWMVEAAIVVKDGVATIDGPGAARFTKFYVNGGNVDFSKGNVDLSAYSGELSLKATTEDGSGVINLKLTK